MMSHEPHNHMRLRAQLLAHGRDPNYPGWPDTLQLNYANPDQHVAQIDELVAIACMCDGVRCDMAMLLLPEVFQRTWGITPPPFWPKTTAAVHQIYPGCTFMAEAYWDLEWILQQQGFDYCYGKRLYDRLKEGAVGPIRDHLRAGVDFQDRLARFLENHGERRATSDGGIPLAAASGGGGGHVLIAWAAPLPPWPVRGGIPTGTGPFLSCPGRSDQSEMRPLLCNAVADIEGNQRISQRRLVADRRTRGLAR